MLATDIFELQSCSLRHMNISTVAKIWKTASVAQDRNTFLLSMVRWFGHKWFVIFRGILFMGELDVLFTIASLGNGRRNDSKFKILDNKWFILNYWQLFVASKPLLFLFWPNSEFDILMWSVWCTFELLDNFFWGGGSLILY